MFTSSRVGFLPREKVLFGPVEEFTQPELASVYRVAPVL